MGVVGGFCWVGVVEGGCCGVSVMDGLLLGECYGWVVVGEEKVL